MKVTPEQMQTAANNLEGLKEQAVATLQHYLNASYEVHGAGSWFGPAAGANVNTAEEIQHAQMQVQTQWQQLIDVLRAEAAKYADREHQNASAISSVAAQNA